MKFNLAQLSDFLHSAGHILEQVHEAGEVVAKIPEPYSAQVKIASDLLGLVAEALNSAK